MIFSYQVSSLIHQNKAISLSAPLSRCIIYIIYNVFVATHTRGALPCRQHQHLYGPDVSLAALPQPGVLHLDGQLAAVMGVSHMDLMTHGGGSSRGEGGGGAGRDMFKATPSTSTSTSPHFRRISYPPPFLFALLFVLLLLLPTITIVINIMTFTPPVPMTRWQWGPSRRKQTASRGGRQGPHTICWTPGGRQGVGGTGMRGRKRGMAIVSYHNDDHGHDDGTAAAAAGFAGGGSNSCSSLHPTPSGY